MEELKEAFPLPPLPPGRSSGRCLGHNKCSRVTPVLGSPSSVPGGTFSTTSFLFRPCRLLILAAGPSPSSERYIHITPFPPSPGRPSGTYFFLVNATSPFPPSPAFTDVFVRRKHLMTAGTPFSFSSEKYSSPRVRSLHLHLNQRSPRERPAAPQIRKPSPRVRSLHLHLHPRSPREREAAPQIRKPSTNTAASTAGWRRPTTGTGRRTRGPRSRRIARSGSWSTGVQGGRPDVVGRDREVRNGGAAAADLEGKRRGLGFRVQRKKEK